MNNCFLCILKRYTNRSRRYFSKIFRISLYISRKARIEFLILKQSFKIRCHKLLSSFSNDDLLRSGSRYIYFQFCETHGCTRLQRRCCIHKFLRLISNITCVFLVYYPKRYGAHPRAFSSLILPTGITITNLIDN